QSLSLPADAVYGGRNGGARPCTHATGVRRGDGVVLMDVGACLTAHLTFHCSARANMWYASNGTISTFPLRYAYSGVSCHSGTNGISLSRCCRWMACASRFTSVKCRTFVASC